MYTGFYETEFDKIALCVESIKTAKIALVEENGIGSDLNINIFGWKNNELATIIQLKDTFGTPKDDRIKSVIEGSVIMRKGWGITEFTLAAEGYCSMAPAETAGQNLASLFAMKNSPVKECISFTHLKSEDHVFVAMPYLVKLGRKIDFGDVLWFDGGKTMRDIEYPPALKAALRLKPEPIDISLDQETYRQTYFGALASAIMKSGFEVFYRDDL